MPERPSIFLMGCVNGGTSIIAKMYNVLGWSYVETHEHHRKFMEVNEANIATVKLRGRMDRLPDKLPTVEQACDGFYDWFRAAERPVICKDHRFSFTMNKLSAGLLEIEPQAALVWLQKDIATVTASIVRRRGKSKGWWWNRGPQQWFEAAEDQYAQWPGQKWTVSFEQVRAAVRQPPPGCFQSIEFALGIELFGPFEYNGMAVARAVFDPTRDNKGHPDQGKDGWSQT